MSGVDIEHDERVAALRETATDECEYSGWVNLAQGALDVIEEQRQLLRGAVEENRKLRALIESAPGAAAGSRYFDWVVEAKGWLTDNPGGQS